MIQFGARALIALAATLLLSGCLVTPGKFASTLSINGDRSFAFTYKGEVVSIDPGEGLKSLGAGEDRENDSEDTDKASLQDNSSGGRSAFKTLSGTAVDKDTAEKERKYRAFAEALSREAGYRSVDYVGDGKFVIDYAITGRLDHNFVYPYNMDAEILFPFMAIEVRKNGTVRVKAPAFGNESSAMDKPGRGEAAAHLDGVFTLDTDAEIVSQNSEEGATSTGGRKIVSWRASAASKDAPMAVLRMR